MIVNSIDGSPSNANQLMDILSLVANTEVYGKKVKELEKLIAENKKYVEAVAPAADILVLRESLQEEIAKNKEATKAAKVAGADKLKAAEEQAAQIIADAQAKADALIAEATATEKEAKAKLKDVQAAEAAAKAAETAHKNAVAHAKGQATLAANEAKAARDLQAEAEAAKAAILAKHEEFIKSL